MENIEWVIAIVVLGMLVYPIMQMIPSPQQKRQVALRQAAMRKGIHIQVRHPELLSAQMEQHPALARTVAYFLPQKTTCLHHPVTAARLHAGDIGWHWLNGISPPVGMTARMLALYATLPDYCLGVEQGTQGSAIFLNDTRESCSAEEIFACLENLNRLIATQEHSTE